MDSISGATSPLAPLLRRPPTRSDLKPTSSVLTSKVACAGPAPVCAPTASSSPLGGLPPVDSPPNALQFDGEVATKDGEEGGRYPAWRPSSKDGEAIKEGNTKDGGEATKEGTKDGEE